MIYDAIDIISKVGITHVCKNWLSQPANAQELKSLAKKYNIFGGIIPMATEDADLWRLLMFVGAGAIVPIQTTGGNYVLGLRDNWEIPQWVYNQGFWKNLSLHVEQMMEIHGSTEILNVRKLILRRAAEMFHDQRIVASPPSPPSNDVEEEYEKIQRLKGETGRLMREWRTRLRRSKS